MILANGQAHETRFPREFIEWAGHHSGGVKRLFDDQSGLPGRQLLRTTLISKLEAWASDVAKGDPSAPRILLLVGGPGNGKTEAIEYTIKCLDQKLGAGGRLLERLAREFHPPTGQPVHRIVRVDAGSLASSPRDIELQIVQDATATAGQHEHTAPELLLDELGGLLIATSHRFYLCCVNRGVLDDALILALDKQRTAEQALLEAIARSVSLSANQSSCWPLEGFPSVAIWPMDAESLLAMPPDGGPAPAATLLECATEAASWPAPGDCPAHVRCPYCHSHSLLARDDHREALLQILRWYELASGKRWSFRDLFSLVSYLMAGHVQAQHRTKADPCSWASHLLRLDEASKQSQRPSRAELTAIFYLATSSYQHALFHSWEHGIATTLGQDIKELALGEHDQEAARTLRGLQHFLHERKTPYLPATIAPVLSSLATLMDPALARPECEVALSARTKAELWELDSRFSRSIADGVEFIAKRQALSPNELDLLKRLSAADAVLSSPLARRKRPATAARVQRTLRDFACRLVRRSICTRSAVVLDAPTLRSFQQVVEDGQGRRLFEVAQRIKNLLNSKTGFEVSLTTTFGQPLPPPQRQAILVVQPQPVRPIPLSTQGRPQPPLRFLQVGQGSSAQPIALTYDLFKAIEEMERGLSPASLPQAVIALLDTTRARLAGPIVRNQEVLADAKIRLGADGATIEQTWDGFVVLDDKEQA
jgi:hypothetical protein